LDLDFGKFTILGYSISSVYLCLVDVLIFDVLISDDGGRECIDGYRLL